MGRMGRESDWYHQATHVQNGARGLGGHAEEEEEEDEEVAIGRTLRKKDGSALVAKSFDSKVAR